MVAGLLLHAIIKSVKTKTLTLQNKATAAELLTRLESCEPEQPLLLAVMQDGLQADPELMDRLMKLQMTSDRVYILFGTRDDFVNPEAGTDDLLQNMPVQTGEGEDS